MRRRVWRPPGFRAVFDAGLRPRQKAIEIFEQAQPSDGLILSKHRIVTFGESAREAYERMIAMVSLAEDFIARNSEPRILVTEWREPEPIVGARANHPWRLLPKR